MYAISPITFGHAMPESLGTSNKYNSQPKFNSLKYNNKACGLNLMGEYNKVLFRAEHKIDADKLRRLRIANLELIGNNIVRGESLSSRRNRKFISPIRECGIESVIDLRDKYASLGYEQLCADAGLRYYNFPVDSASVDDRVIIDNLPEMCRVMDQGKLYIACAQGLHRTDIALAINYMFNPSAQTEPPVMKGHFREYGFKSDDIIRRINSIKKALTKDDLKKIGWDDSFEEQFAKRKKIFVDLNNQIASNMNTDNGEQK